MLKTENKSAWALIFLCSFMYFISYVTRTNYGAAVLEISTATGLERTSLAVALTGSFIAYGIGQLLSGYLGDKIQPKFLIAGGITLTVLMNFVIPFCATSTQMTIFWTINGLAQSFMWPPAVKMLAVKLNQAEYQKGTQLVNWAAQIATIFIYLVTPLIITLLNWKGVFYVSSVLGVIGLAVWLIKCPLIDLNQVKVNNSGEKQKVNKAPFGVVLVLVMIAIVCMGMLRDGITTWMPTYIADTYNLSNEISILTGVLLPIFALVCYTIVSYLYKNKLKNPLTCAFAVFAVGLLSAGLLSLFASSSPVISVLLSALLTGSMYGVNLILVCMVPGCFKKFSNVSFISGLLNCCTYVGSAVSTYCFPLLAAHISWSGTIFVWFIIALVGSALCLISVPLWNKFKEKL